MYDAATLEKREVNEGLMEPESLMMREWPRCLVTCVYLLKYSASDCFPRRNNPPGGSGAPQGIGSEEARPVPLLVL